MRTRRLLLLLLLPLPLAGLPGCQKDETIATYDVPHPERQKMRLLAAIVPHGESTWFVRVSGPEAAVAEQKPGFDAFVKSIQFDDNAKPPIRWTAPESWTEEGGSAMSKLAFRIKAEPQPLQATLTRFGKFGERENTLKGNINRWRNQLRLPPVSEEEAPALAKPEGNALVVDLTGVGVPRKAAPAMEHPPMEHPPMEHPPIGDHPPIAAGPAKGMPFRYEAPKAWEPAGGGYEVREGSAKARVTITGLRGDGGGVLANLRRWRQDPGQAALAPIPDAEILKQAKTLEIAGLHALGGKATYADYIGNRVRILAVILPDRDKTWFVKMTGPPDLVGRHKAEFETFIHSFRLDTE